MHVHMHVSRQVHVHVHLYAQNALLAICMCSPVYELVEPNISCYAQLHVCCVDRSSLLLALQSSVPDLSIVPLDSTTSQFEPLPFDLTALPLVSGVPDLTSLHSQLSAFHDSVCAMVQQHIATTDQVHVHVRKFFIGYKS